MDINEIQAIIKKSVIDKYDNYSKASKKIGMQYPTVVRICEAPETVKLETLLKFVDKMNLQLILASKVI
jgi:hypothetical protein